MVGLVQHLRDNRKTLLGFAVSVSLTLAFHNELIAPRDVPMLACVCAVAAASPLATRYIDLIENTANSMRSANSYGSDMNSSGSDNDGSPEQSRRATPTAELSTPPPPTARAPGH